MEGHNSLNSVERYAALTHAQRIDALVEIQKSRSALDAAEQRLLAAIESDPTPDVDCRDAVLAKHYVREDVACALRLAFGTAESRLHIAHVLVHQLPDTLSALDAGRLTYLHCRALVEGIAPLNEDLAAQVEARVLGPAGTQTVGEFRRAVKKAVLAVDPASAEDKHARAVEDRRVEVFSGEDGMSTLWASIAAEDGEAVKNALDTAAGRLTDDRTMDQRRADLLVGAVLGLLDRADVVEVTRHGRKPAVHVSVALSTLLGYDQQPADLDGYGPITAAHARRIAFDPTGTWRRLVTDELGHLIDYGRSTYRPPQALQDHVIARDRTCRMTGCSRRAVNCELDHRQPWEHDGTTCAANLEPLCPRHHHLRHEAGWQVTRTDDGTTVWISPTGHRYTKPPATYPLDTTTDAIAQPPAGSAADGPADPPATERPAAEAA